MVAAVAEPASPTCVHCGREGKTPRLPRGWKRHRDVVACAACWVERHALRAVTLEVASPAPGDDTWGWPELRAELAKLWAQSSSLANWAVSELWARDIRRTPDLERLPAMESVYLYPEARRLYPAIPTQSVVSILQAVDRRYRERRVEVIWRGAESIPTYRYPAPYPLHNQGWSAELGPGGEPLVSLRLAGERRALRLRASKRGGRGPRITMARFREIVSGAALQGELAIFRRRAASSTHRPGLTARLPGGGGRVAYEIAVKLVAWFPRHRVERAGETLLLRTDPSCYWVGEIAGREPWVLHADHVWRWIREHERWLAHLHDDQKWERRRNSKERSQINTVYRERAERHARRCREWIRQSVALVTGLSQRQGVSTIVYTDTEVRDHRFGWAALRDALATRCHDLGITLASGDVVEKTS